MIDLAWDLVVSLVFIILIVYGLALGRERVLVLLVSSYIGLVVALVWGGAVYGLLSGTSATTSGLTVRANFSELAIKSVIFMVITLLLVVKGDFLKKASTSHDGLMSFVISGIYAIFSAGLILASISFFLSDAIKTEITDNSALAAMIVNYREWWIVLPVFLIIAIGFRGSSSPQ